MAQQNRFYAEDVPQKVIRQVLELLEPYGGDYDEWWSEDE